MDNTSTLPEALVDFAAVRLGPGPVLLVLRPRGHLSADHVERIAADLERLALPPNVRFMVLEDMDVMVLGDVDKLTDANGDH